VRTCLCHRLLRARDWQDRPQLEAVCGWWREGGPGVCSLVGIGGAGKTAVADRFLQLLPGATEEAPDVPKDGSLPVPDGLFVFSFYDAPNPEQFFDRLYDWLVRDFGVPDRRRTTESGTRLQASASQVIDTLSNLRSHVRHASTVPDFRVLLVLDGMEKVQDDGSRGGVFGHIEDGGLRAFLLRTAAGWMPGVSVLVTTRFVPDDLEYERERGTAPLYAPIDVERISETACIRLLRDRGVRGGDGALRGIARECGRHALTVDLAATYLVQFCDGDPHAPLDMPTPEELQQLAGQTRDRRLRYVAEQSARFAKLAQRYRDALRRSDPAALALLERICLFRLGVAADTLAAVFTGRGKEEISGPELAHLSREDLDFKLALLTDMRLVERSDPASPSGPTEADSSLPSPYSGVSYTVHPAVRDGFLAGLDPEAARSGHDAAKEGLEVALGRRGGVNPSDPATLDLLEEIVYHTVEAGHVADAWGIYEDRIGQYENLGWRLGAYERGERICRAFAGGKPPETAPLPDGLSKHDQPNFINEWALYLSDLGRLAAAARCYERHNEIRMHQENWRDASIGSLNLAETCLLAGRLAPGLRVAEEGVRLAALADDAEQRGDSHAYRAHAHALQGDTGAALADFRDALHWQHEHQGESERPLYSLTGIWQTLLLARLRRNEDATRLTEWNKRYLLDTYGPQDNEVPKCGFVLADLARERGDLSSALELLDQGHAWALQRDAKEPLCWAALVRARICRVRETHHIGESAPTVTGQPEDGAFHAPYEAARAIEEGLRIARECGFGIFHVDLLLERARLHLLSGDAEAAQADARTALFDGHTPLPDSGLPTLLSATHPECGYAWGIAAGRHLLAEALLSQAAQTLGRTEFTPARFHELPADVQRLVNEAREELTQCLELRERIQDPKAAETQNVITSLKGGVLTEYPLTVPKPKEAAPTPGPELPPGEPKGGAMQNVKILFLAANPSGTDPLALDQEAREIEAKIRASKHRDSLELITKWAVRPDDLLQYLNQHRPHVVHFSGHGSPSDEIILNDEHGQPKPVSKAALQKLFRVLKDNIRVVVLNACFSRPQARAIVGEIDCAIGMTKAIGDQAAITFAASFYRAIGFGRSVQEAFDQGVAALLLEGIPEEKTPKLLVRDGVDASQVVLVSGE